MQQIAPRKAPTYGKKSQSGRFAQGINLLAERSPSKSLSRLQRPSQSPAKLRKKGSAKPRGFHDFDVPSSDDELMTEVQYTATTPEPTRSQQLREQNTSNLHGSFDNEKLEMNVPQSRQKLQALASNSGMSSRIAKENIAESAISLEDNSDQHITLDELDQAQSVEADMEVKKITTTPRQSRLWTELLQEESDQQQQSRKRWNTSMGSTDSKKNRTDTSTERPNFQKLSKLVENLRPSEDRQQESLGDTNNGLHGSNIHNDDDVNAEEPTLNGLSVANVESHITYSQQRTCLEDEANNGQHLMQPLEDCSCMRDDDNRMLDEWEPPGATSADNENDGSGLKSIHELRAAGDALRFDNEVSDLLENASADGHHSLQIQRSGLIVLATKLESQSFRRRFLHGSYQQKLFQNIFSNKDILCLTASAAALAFVLNDDSNAINASHACLAEIPLEALCSSLVDSTTLTKIANNPERSLSQLARKSILDFDRALRNSGLFAIRDSVELTPRVIGLRLLEIILLRTGDASNCSSLLTSSILHQLVCTGKAILADREDEFLDILKSTLSILEMSTISRYGKAEDSPWSPQVVQEAVILIEAAVKLDGEYGKPIRRLVLKMCLNLSNNCERNSDILNSSRLVAALLDLIRRHLEAGSFRKYTTSVRGTNENVSWQIDDLILALGAMMNLAEMSALVRRSVEREHRAAFDSIVQLFIDNQARNHEDITLLGASQQIAFGYVAILLANLAQEPRLRARIVTKLPSGHIESLLEVVEEFVDQHLEADRESQHGQDWVDFTQRLQGIVESLKDIVQI